MDPEPANEAEKVTHTAEGLKELALNFNTAVVAVVAADNAGWRPIACGCTTAVDPRRSPTRATS